VAWITSSVNRRANELKGFGVGAGDWVGLMLGSVPEFVVLSLALSKLDAVVVPLDPTLSGRDLNMVFAATHLRALVNRPNALTPLCRPGRRAARGCETRPTARCARKPTPHFRDPAHLFYL